MGAIDQIGPCCLNFNGVRIRGERQASRRHGWFGLLGCGTRSEYPTLLSTASALPTNRHKVGKAHALAAEFESLSEDRPR